MEKKINQTNQNPLENSKEWVFLAIRKDLIAKRTDKYALVKLACGRSVIFSSKFIRAKESEDKIYASLPSDYKLTCRTTDYNDVDEKWVVRSERNISPKQLHYQLYLVEKHLKEGFQLEEILDYHFEELPF